MPDSQRSKPFHGRWKWMLLSLLIFSFAAGAFLLKGGHPYVLYLNIYEGCSEKIVFSERVEVGDILELNYIHSSDGTPVKVMFEIQQEGLYLLEESYSWYGAGLESGAGHSFSFEGDEVIVGGYDRVFNILPIRVARTVPQEITLSDHVIILNQLAAGGTLLIIKVEIQ